MKFYIEENHGIDRIEVPVQIGLPLKSGYIHDSKKLHLIDSHDKSIPIETRILSRWHDKSVKWVLIIFKISLSGFTKSAYKLIKKDYVRNFNEGIYVEENKQEIIVDTGKKIFTISKKTFSPFNSVKSRSGRKITEKAKSNLILTDSRGTQHYPKINKIRIENRGEQSTTILIEGTFDKLSIKTICRYRARIQFFAGSSIVRMEIELHNPKAALHPFGTWDLGDPGSIYFGDLTISVALNKDNDILTSNLLWYDDANGIENKFKNKQRNCHRRKNENLKIFQASSGGKNWNSPNHVNRNSVSNHPFNGYKIYIDQKDIPHLAGLRARPLMIIKNDNCWISGTIIEFWQNFPKALRSENGNLEFGLFPYECGQEFELQGGEKKRHVIWLEFGNKFENDILKQNLYPLQITIDQDDIEACKVLLNFTPYKNYESKLYLDYIKNGVEGNHSFQKKREIIDEYGWRNFGDLYADHEAINSNKKNYFISHYNNQYDFVFGALFHYLCSGDYRWYKIGSQCAKHVIDIDIYHTNKDKIAYNNGLFWHTDHYKDAGTSTHRTYSYTTIKSDKLSNYGGGPSNEHNYTSGLLLYHFLTGDQEAAKAVIDLAGWVIDMDKVQNKYLFFIKNKLTGHASKTVSFDYHKAGRGSGNSINALIDALTLTGETKYLEKAQELIVRCIHPKDKIDELNLDQPEHRWSYLIFLQVLIKYINKKIELNDFDYYFFYAKDSLLHYAKWIANNEKPYKDVLEKVNIPTETWSAHDIRKCDILNAASQFLPNEKSRYYRKKARFFYDRCLKDLFTYDTAHLTRPMVILLVHGSVHGKYTNTTDLNTNCEKHRYNYGEPNVFVPTFPLIATVFQNKPVFLLHELYRQIYQMFIKIYEKMLKNIYE